MLTAPTIKTSYIGKLVGSIMQRYASGVLVLPKNKIYAPTKLSEKKEKDYNL